MFLRSKTRAEASAPTMPARDRADAARDPLVSVIVPAYNEATRIEEVLHKIAAVPVRKEIIVVNDGSTDHTAAVLDRLSALYDRRHDMNPNGGKGAAVLQGIKLATGDLVLVQDADGELDPSEYPNLLAPFARSGVNAVFGSRFSPDLPKSARPKLPFISRAANWVITAWANALYGSSLTDVETGFKLCRRELINSLELRPSRYEFEVELTAKLLRTGIQIIEVPVTYRPRPRAEKTIGFKDGVAALRVLAELRFTRFSAAHSHSGSRSG